MTLKITRAAALATILSAALLASACMSMDDGMSGDGMSAGADAEATVMVGGAAMYPSRNIVENAVNSADHTTLVAAVTAAGLADTLANGGPYTVFAPTNAAFAKLPAGTVETLVMPANKAALSKILTYHVVPGRLAASDIARMISRDGGSHRLITVEGGTLTASMRGNAVILTDEMGGVSTVTQADVFQSNGVIHVTDTVSMPN